MLFVVAGHLLEVIACLQKSTLNAICRGRRYFCKSLLSSEVDFERYLWCSRALGHFIVCLRCLILMLFVVAGHLLEVTACLQKLTLNAICRGRTSSVSLCFSSEVDFERYLWCSRALGHFIVCLRCLTLTLFVVAGHTFGGHCFSSMLDFDAICGVPEHLAILLFAFDA